MQCCVVLYELCKDFETKFFDLCGWKSLTFRPSTFPTQYHSNFFPELPLWMVVVMNHIPRLYKNFAVV